MLKGKKKLSGAMIQCDRGGGIYDQVLLDTVSRGAQAGFCPRERVRHNMLPMWQRSNYLTKRLIYENKNDNF